jgi:hypothetical protein
LSSWRKPTVDPWLTVGLSAMVERARSSPHAGTHTERRFERAAAVGADAVAFASGSQQAWHDAIGTD